MNAVVDSRGRDISLPFNFRAAWAAFGNLNNGIAAAGLSYVNGNNGLGNAWWNNASRTSR